MKIAIALLLLLLIPILLIPTTNAQVTCANTGAEVNARWGTHNISVNVPLVPSDGYALAVQALQIWNDSQKWFSNTYYPHSPTYSFILSNNTLSYQVHVQFGNERAVGGGSLGLTFPQLTGNNTNFTGALVEIAVNYGTTNTTLTTAIHEFGHVLGLVYTPACSQDVMWNGNNIGGWLPQDELLIYPSTLDLYAVHMNIMENVSAPFRAILPSNIPYMQYPTSELPVPEFPSGLVMFVVLSLGAAVLQLTVRRRTQ